MEKTKFLPFRRMCLYLFLSLSPLIGSSQSTLACNDAVQISLGSMCGIGDVNADMFLEGDLSQLPAVTEVCLQIKYIDQNGKTQSAESCVMSLTETFDAIPWSILIGQTVKYSLQIEFASGTINSCWGDAIIEDKLPPFVDCYNPDESFVGYVYKYDVPWVIKAIDIWADGYECFEFNAEAGVCTNEEYNEIIPFDEHGIVWLNIAGMPIAMPFNITTIYGFLQDGCIEDNCATEFDIHWRLYEDPESPYLGNDCPPAGAPISSYILEYYIEVPQPHGMDPAKVVIAEFSFGVLRPGFPEFPHNVTVYCTDDEDVTSPEGIARQLDDIYDCGFLRYKVNGYSCPEEFEDDCNQGIPYAYPYWETHDCFQPLISKDSHGYCKYFAVHEDQVLLDDCCLYKLLRKWKVVDWCTSTVEEFYQVIERHDHSGPKLHGDKPVPKELSIKPWLCYADLYIPNSAHYPYLEAKDACCDAEIKVSIHLFDESHSNIGREALNMTPEEFMKHFDVCEYEGEVVIDDLSIGDHVTLDKGKYIIRYQAIDECGNEGEYFCIPLWVLDKTPPVPVCEDEVVASLTLDYDFADGGIAKIFAESFDQGSHDAGCGDVCIEVIRMEDFNSTPVYGDGGKYGYGYGYGDDEEECLPYYRVVECWEGKPIETQTPWGYEPVTCFAVNDTILVPSGYDKYGKPAACVEKEIAAFGDYVKFCCEDLGRDDLFVVMRVWDHWGNYNDCMVKVMLQNKIDATIICGKDLYLKCEEYPDNPYDAYLYGPTVDALCGEVELHYEDVHNFDDCGYGLTYRYWKATFAGETVAQCIQHVYINQYDDYFDPRSIKWPAHHTGETVYGQKITCVDGEPEVTNSNFHFYLPPPFDCMDLETCVPEWDENHCGLIGWSVESDTVYFEDAACVKIINRWTVIDWCTWDPNRNGNYDDPSDPWRWVSDHTLGDCGGKSCFDDGYSVYAHFVDETCIFTETKDPEHGGGKFTCDVLTLDGYYVWDQVIKVINTTPPELDDCSEVEFEVDADCKGSIILTNSATDEEDCGGKWLKWKVELFDVHWQLIDYWDIHSSIGEEVVINAATEDGWDSDSKAEGYVYPGTYIARWTVKDGCGNEAVCIQYLLVVDKKPPTPICHANISTAFMQPSGQVTIWANDFDLKSFDNCTPEEELEYEIRFAGSTSNPTASVTITCEDLVNDHVELEVWVSDESGNSDYCDVTVFVSDDSDICEDTGSGTAMVSGRLMNEMGDFVEAASVELSSDHPEYPVMLTTSEDGLFAFPDNPMSRSYEINADRDGDDLNGVSTIDLVLIQKHILGLESLDSPYKIIAADINGDSRLSAADLVELRKLILGIYEELPENKSWRFVDAKQKLDAVNPFPFTESIEIRNLNRDMVSEDFVGIKIGDVNEDSKANETVNVEVRNKGDIVFVVTDQQLNEGDWIDLEVKAGNFQDVIGYQMTLQHEGLQLENVTSGALDIDESNFASWTEKLSMSWNSVSGVSTDEVLFTLTFRAMNSLILSETLEINSSVTPVEAYVGEGLDRMNIQLAFRNETSSFSPDEFKLYQNEPNPFNKETVISFVLPAKGKAMLTVMDVTGKLVHVEEGEYAKGYNEVIIRGEELNVSGVLYYRLENGAYSATKKMILIK